jgi:hypothetical protein
VNLIQKNILKLIYCVEEMSKDTFYFSHDYEPTSDPKIQAMLGQFGAIGYGLYWRIIEMLHSDNEHKLQKKQYIYLALAQQMLTDVEQVTTFVEQCINVFELFESDQNNFWSDRVKRNIEIRNINSANKSKAGKISAEMRKKATGVEQVLTGVQQNPTKERKGKERKEKKNKDIIYPSSLEVENYFFENGYKREAGKKAFNYYSTGNWIDSKGNKVRNWKQKMQAIWFKDENKIIDKKPESVMCR